MKKLTAAAFALASILYAPVPVFAGSDVAIACGDDVPAGWKRPGGYCDQIEKGNSLSVPGPANACDETIYARLGVDRLEAGESVEVAVVDPCCAVVVGYNADDLLNGILLAASPCNPCPTMFREYVQDLPAGTRLMAAC